ncbi:hypothetical protein TNCT_43861 [Trichonephila clavata]|uniref:Uncharacterized protein n=1 Tax=Trichonephila clavata TaxID=2740835 RepID=A0A8X6H304_TRICU|nr:hypothetical protein TNCT_43861 [Trichonephila clavata]
MFAFYTGHYEIDWDESTPVFLLYCSREKKLGFRTTCRPQIEALVLHLELKNEDSTPSIEGRPRCPSDFVK